MERAPAGTRDAAPSGRKVSQGRRPLTEIEPARAQDLGETWRRSGMRRRLISDNDFFWRSASRRNLTIRKLLPHGKSNF